MAFNWVVIVVGALLSSLAFADNAPDWTRHAPRETATDKFYVGRASNASNETEGFNKALRDAYDAAIRENFGFITKIDSDAYEKNGEMDSLRRSQEISDEIQIRNFEQQDYYVEHNSGGVNVWILFRYAKSAIAEEKLRLRSVIKTQPVTHFSEQGDPANASKGVLEIQSTPPGASITLDGDKLFGTTPMRLYGSVALGKHTIILDHPQFEMKVREVVILPNAVKKINEILAPAKGKLSVISEPSGAAVVANGKYLGPTPLIDVSVDAGRPIRVQVSHPQAETVAQQVQVDRAQSRELKLSLPLKPAHLAITTNPSGATVTIDGSAAPNTPTGHVRVDAGDHQIVIHKEGYIDDQESAHLDGGEIKVIGPIRLTSVSEKERIEAAERERQQKAEEAQQAEQDRRDKEQREEEERQLSEQERHIKYFPWLLDLDIGWSGNTFHGDPNNGYVYLGLGIEKKFFGLFGLSITGTLDYYSANSSNTSTYNMNGTSLTAALPIYPVHSIFIDDDSIFVDAEYGILSHNYVPPQEGAPVNPFSINQNRMGVGIGYRAMFWNRWGIVTKIAGYQYSNDGINTGMTSGAFTLGVTYKF